MLKRSFLAGTIAALALAPRAFAATSIRIWGLWANDPTPGGNALNQLKGTLHFRLNGDTVDRNLNTYGNGPTATAPDRQCVELIKRYAGKLGFAGYSAALGAVDNGNSLPDLGYGNDCAQKFAAKSNGGFIYVVNGAVDLPKAGAVISIQGWDTLPEGHCGIMCNHDAPTTQTTDVFIKVFEQNMPIDTWKIIHFHRANGRWTGTMANKGFNRPVAGWENPTG